MNTYYNYGTYYVSYTSNSTSTWSNWYGNNTVDWVPQKARKNYELTHLLKKYDGELRKINKMKQALGR